MPDFLDSLIGGAGQAAGGGLIGSLLSAFGKKRISNKDFLFYQDLADTGNRRDIARQNQYLAGVTPANADAYNQYQDMTIS